MSKEIVLAPKIDLIKSDEFQLFYEMMVQSLKTDDVKEGINKSLSLLRMFLNSSNIALFRKNENGIYVFKLSDSRMNELIQPIGCIVNKTKKLIEQKEIFHLNLCSFEKFNNTTMLYFKIASKNYLEECIVTIINNELGKELSPLFWERVKDTMQIILKRALSYERNTKAITIDLLTGLDNRNSYETRLHELNENDDKLVLAIFDIFRLKYVNDNFTHDKGDIYIKEVANILNKYWPKQKVKTNDDGIEKFINTGHCVYRVGGDEFVLLTNVERLQLTEIKAKLAQDESEMINLNILQEIPLGINFGVVQHNPGDFIKQTFIKADKLMQEDKKQMYKKYKIDRRI